MKNPQLSELAGKYIKMLLYGKAGAGKTTLAYSATLDERTSPVLAIDCIGNAGSAFGMAKDVTIIQLDSIKEFNPVYDFLFQGQPKGHEFRKMAGINDTIVYKTLIIDSLTELQTMMLNSITGADKSNIGDTRPKPTFNDFGQVLGQTLSLVKVIVALPINIIFTCLEEERKNDSGVIIGYDVLLQGKAKEQVPGIFHTLGRVITYNKFPPAHLEALKKEAASLKIPLKATTNIVLFAPLGNFEAKDQGKPKLPDFIILPTITDILDIRQGLEA